jgi:predicted cupin superfamily sugar epimerase
MTKDELIAHLGLSGHFEGGYFRETFRAEHRDRMATPQGPRTTMTSILYMLTDDSPLDPFHTKHSDGIQFFHLGAPVTYHLIHPDGRHERVVLGPDLAAGHRLQLAVKGGTWKAAVLEEGDYGLVSEVVVPGWEMEDMIFASRPKLQSLFPQHHELLNRLATE